MSTQEATTNGLPDLNSIEPEQPKPPHKQNGIAARLLHGTGAGAFAYVLGIASNLLLLPLYLRCWSVAEYGEWMAIYSMVSYLNNLDFGITTAAINGASMAYARGDVAAFKRIQGTAWVTSMVLAVAGGMFVTGLALFYFHGKQWLGLTVFTQAEARAVFCFLAFSLLATLPGRQLSAVYVAIGEFYKYQWLWNVSALATCIVTGIALWHGVHPVTLAALTGGVTLLTVVATYSLLRRRNPWLVPRMRDCRWSTARSLAAPTGQFGISILATTITLQGPIIILSRLLGGPAVALFTTTRTVANVVRGTLSLLRAPLRPEFAAASTEPTKDRLRSLFRIAVGIDIIVALSLSAALWSGGIWLIEFWSRGRIAADPRLLHLLLVLFALEGFLMMLAGVGSATNRLRGVSVAQLTTAILSLGLAFVLIGRFGPSAIPLSGIFPLLLFLLPSAVLNASREIDMPVWRLVRQIFLPCVSIAILTFALSSWLSLHWTARPLSAAVASLLAACIVCPVVVWTAVITTSDRSTLRTRLRIWTT